MVTTNGIFLVDSKNKILLVHPTNGRWNDWSIPKGLGDAGETSLDSAMRELKEETNIDLYKLMEKYGYDYYYLGTQPYKSGKKQIEGHLFRIKSDLSENALNLKCESMIGETTTPECDKIEWYEFPKALELMHESQSEIFNKYLTY